MTITTFRHRAGVDVSGLDEKTEAQGLSSDRAGHDISICKVPVVHCVLYGGLGQANGLDGKGSTWARAVEDGQPPGRHEQFNRTR